MWQGAARRGKKRAESFRDEVGGAQGLPGTSSPGRRRGERPAEGFRGR